MNIQYFHLPKYKNLEDFVFEVENPVPIQVIIGQNGTGKSNFIEALAVVFSSLYYNNSSGVF